MSCKCSLKMKFYLIIFLLLRDNKNISSWHNILNNVHSKNLVLHEKQFCAKKKFCVGQKVFWCRKNKFMLHEKVFHVKKKLMLHKNCISCRQEQYDAAQEKKNCAQKIYSFFWGTAHHTNMNLMYVCFK